MSWYPRYTGLTPLNRSLNTSRIPADGIHITVPLFRCHMLQVYMLHSAARSGLYSPLGSTGLAVAVRRVTCCMWCRKISTAAIDNTTALRTEATTISDVENIAWYGLYDISGYL